MADLAVKTVDTVLPAQAEDQLKTLIDDFLMDLEISRRSPHELWDRAVSMDKVVWASRGQMRDPPASAYGRDGTGE